MTKTIRLILLLVVASVALTPAAQAQLRYGFRFGGVFADASLKDAGSLSLDNKSGFSGGLMLEYQMPKCGFAADIAVVYTRYNTHLLDDGVKTKPFGRDFIEVPLHLKYKFWLPAFHDLFGPLVYTGPSLMIRTSDSGPENFTTRPLQPGWDVGIGFDIVNFIQITGGYRFGLGNAAKNAPGNATYRTNGWNVAANLIFDF